MCTHTMSDRRPEGHGMTTWGRLRRGQSSLLYGQVLSLSLEAGGRRVALAGGDGWGGQMTARSPKFSKLEGSLLLTVQDTDSVS